MKKPPDVDRPRAVIDDCRRFRDVHYASTDAGQWRYQPEVASLYLPFSLLSEVRAYLERWLGVIDEGETARVVQQVYRVSVYVVDEKRAWLLVCSRWGCDCDWSTNGRRA